MNQLALTVIWLILQISLLCLITAFIYGIARRGNPTAGASTVLTGLLLVAFLTVIAFCPWPAWSFADADRSETTSFHQDNPATVTRSEHLQDRAFDDLNSDSVDEPTSFARLEYLAALWQELQSSVSEQNDIIPKESRPSWIGWLVVIVPAGAAIGLIRLIMGLVSVRHFRRQSRPVDDPAMTDLVAVLCAEFQCRRPIEMRDSSEISSAATVGWRRPLVLLPTEWTSWSEQERRSVLAHEIAHISHNDFAYWLAAQIGLLLHFYHPLVHWLASRLRLEQELAADAAAARCAGGSQSYLTTLAELALHQDDRPVPWPARTFIPTRGTLMTRIEMLRNSRKNTVTRSGWRRGAVISIVMLAGVFVSGLRLPSYETASAQDQNTPVQSAKQPGKTLREANSAKSQEDGFDLRYVPPTTSVLIGARPSGIATDDSTKPMMEMLNQSIKQQNIGLTVDDFQQVLIAGFPIDENDIDLFPVAVMILTTKQPNNFVELIKAVGGETTDEVRNGSKYQKNSAGKAFHQLDDRTLVYGNEPVVTFLMDVVKGGPGKVLWHREFALVAKSQFCAVFDVIPIRKQIEPETTRSQGNGLLAAFSPLWRETKLIVVGADLIGNMKLQLTAYCESEDGAVKVERTAASLVPLARNMIGDEKDQFAKLSPEVQGPASSMIAFVETLLDEVKFERVGRQVSIKAENVNPATPILWAVLPAFQSSARAAARRTMSSNNLKQIAIGLHNYHDTFGHFPAPAVLGRDGKTVHSWRVAILPYLGEAQLYKEYKLDEPWNSEHNLKLLKKRPAAFQSPHGGKNTTESSYFALTGADTAFGQGNEGIRLREITDGASKTILVVEAKREIPWTKPEDIPFHMKGELPKLGGFDPTGFNAAFCDGSVLFFEHKGVKNILRHLITRSGKEVVEFPKRKKRNLEEIELINP